LNVVDGTAIDQWRSPRDKAVDTDKVEANFNKGVLTVTLPKKPEAQEPEKKIEVKPT
jgi:hypothetical protein